MIKEPHKIIDISQPISRSISCFPGDTPFDYSLKASYLNNSCYNVTAFKMSPHIGTHADAPAHTLKAMEMENLIGNMPLAPFIGPCLVIDLCPCHTEIRLKDIEEKLHKNNIPSRILFRTRCQSRFDLFDEQSAYLSPEIIDFLSDNGVQLIGIDTPSVDAICSKTLDVHHALISRGMMWLENLDLTSAKEEVYFLSALPIKFMELEAAPVRAVLVSFKTNQAEDFPC